MKIKIVLISLLLVVLNFGNAGHAKETRIINRHGTQIPSIFYGLSPNPKITPEYFRVMKTNSWNTGPCPVLKTADGLIATFLLPPTVMDIHSTTTGAMATASNISGGSTISPLAVTEL